MQPTQKHHEFSADYATATKDIDAAGLKHTPAINLPGNVESAHHAASDRGYGKHDLEKELYSQVRRCCCLAARRSFLVVVVCDAYDLCLWFYGCGAGDRVSRVRSMRTIRSRWVRNSDPTSAPKLSVPHQWWRFRLEFSVTMYS